MNPYPRFLLTAPFSGAGKTTVTCGILQALRRRGLETAAFKCGPDYVDPLFHAKAMGIACRNLDPFFCEGSRLSFLLQKNARGKDISVLEGVMGYYDGIGGDSLQASTFEVARRTQTPGVLVVPCQGISFSAVALVEGFLRHQSPSFLQGVILNQVSPMLYPRLQAAIERELSLPVFGYLPSLPEVDFPSRDLGLIPPQELPHIQSKLERLAKQAEQTLDLDGLISLAKTAPPLADIPSPIPPAAPDRPTIAVARDAAFCFHYADNLSLLQDLGADPVYFSPLEDTSLPEPCDGIWLGGGYPERFAAQLSENTAMCSSIRSAWQRGIPFVAEGGGFLYLHRDIRDRDGNTYPLAGVFPGTAYPAGKLQDFGYWTLTARQDGLLCRKGESIRCHEFHTWASDVPGEAFLAQKPHRSRHRLCAHVSPSGYAGFPHLYLYANPSFAARFVQACREICQQRSCPL